LFCACRQRFSLLFYGLGSKRALLESFADEALTDGGVLACDGLAAGVNSKQVLQAVASALTHRSCKSHSHSELLSLIVSEPPCRQLYVLLHNIDGPGGLWCHTCVESRTEGTDMLLCLHACKVQLRACNSSRCLCAQACQGHVMYRFCVALQRQAATPVLATYPVCASACGMSQAGLSCCACLCVPAGLRSGEEQLWLSRLSQAPAVRLVASVDHVNAALLWNSRVAAAFNWLWVDGTMYAGYDAETANVAPIITSKHTLGCNFTGPLLLASIKLCALERCHISSSTRVVFVSPEDKLVRIGLQRWLIQCCCFLVLCAGCKQSATKRGATTVLSTLVSNAREVFKVLAAQQLQDPTAAGVSYPMLLKVVRERYIMTGEQGLKSVLAEFRDHELIKFRAGPDGAEVMFIPMEPDMLQGALQEMQQADEAAA
jgi:hypothetical protein